MGILNRFNMNRSLPFQKIPGQRHIYLVPLNGFINDISFIPHRHEFMTFLWLTKGFGRQQIDFKEYDLRPGRLFFIQQGQTHQVTELDGDGWIILFNELLITGFLSANRHEELLAIMDMFIQIPFIEIDEQKQGILNDLFLHLGTALNKKPANLKLAQHYILLIFLNADDRQDESGKHNLSLIRDLKALIEKHFIRERKVLFYSNFLNTDSQKLNRIVKERLGKSLHRLIIERLLFECKILLLTPGNSIKEVAYQLEFSDMAQFTKFFKKHTGKTPTNYRLLNNMD
jgi:AraC family transcriptional activator of pobA